MSGTTEEFDYAEHILTRRGPCDGRMRTGGKSCTWDSTPETADACKRAYLMFKRDTGVRPSLVLQVMKYAEAHYNDGGWDVIVECWEPRQIAETIKGCNTLAAVLKGSGLSAVVGVWSDREADVFNSAS
jgi:hypothetical protein